MRIEDYQAAAQRTSTADHDKILNGCLGLMGEAGEVVDVIKKWMFQSGQNAPLPREKLIDELGDVIWYCGELCAGLFEKLTDVREGELEDGVVMHRWTLDAYAAHLAARAARPYHSLYGEERSPCPYERRVEIAKIHVREILVLLEEMLYILHSSLEEAMERNIEKLKRRYPDGFDPEKSLNRAEE